MWRVRDVLPSTGIRRGELIALRWTDVSPDQREIHVAAAISDGGPGIVPFDECSPDQ